MSAPRVEGDDRDMSAGDRLKHARNCTRTARQEIRKLTYELLRIAGSGNMVGSWEASEILKLMPQLAELAGSVEQGGDHLRKLRALLGKPEEATP